MINNKGGYALGIALFVLGIMVQDVGGVVLVWTGMMFIFVLLIVEGYKGE